VAVAVTSEHFYSPRNVGDLQAPDACGQNGSLICGAVMRISLRVNEQKVIREAKFKVAGCTSLIVSASLLTEKIRGRSTAEAAERARLLSAITVQAFGLPPEGREHCASIAGEALLIAIRNYSDSLRAEWAGEDALICACFGVSEHTIEEEIRVRNLNSPEEVAHKCGAGGGCGSCIPLVQDILDEMRSGAR